MIRKKLARIKRKIKRKISAIINDSTKSTTTVKTVETFKNKPIFSIKQVCEIIDIDVPNKYKKVSSKKFIDTEIINNLENKNEIINNIEKKEDFDLKYYADLKKYMLNFKEKYFTQECFEKTEDRLIEMIFEWYYLFDNYGFNYNDYFDYEMYNKKIIELNKFLNSRYRGVVYSVCNNKEYTINFKNKASFNKRFEKFIHRDWVDATNCTYDKFEKFVLNHPRFFSKPVGGTGGEGAGIKEKTENIEELFKICKKNKLICEEIVKQHKDMASFNEDTLNTCRIYTLLTLNEEPVITLGMVRFGRKGNEVDNFHCGGVSAGIDLKTGKINTNAINRAHLKFEKHPDSNKEFIGFKIPCWEKLCETVCEAAKLFPEIRHVGWDVAITENNEIEFIEGNAWPNFDITQAVDQIGKKHRYKKYIDELRKAKK